MRTCLILALTAAITLCAAPSFAADTAQQNTMKSCAASWKAMPAADQGKTKYKDYMSGCLKKTPAPAMTMAAKPVKDDTSMKMAAPTGGGSAKCKDGKVVTYKSRSGTCSGHGGVATWM